MAYLILSNKESNSLLSIFSPVIFEDMVCLVKNINQSQFNEKSLLAILDSLPYGLFITDEENKIVYFNLAAERITGATISDVIGKYCRDIFNSDICEKDCTQKNICAAKDDITIREFDIRRSDGITFPIICTISPVSPGNGTARWMYVFKDIAARKRLEDDIKFFENRYRSIFEGSKDMIFITSKDSSITDVNQACLDILEYGSKEELLSLPSVETLFNNSMHWRVFQEQIERFGFIKDFEACFRKKDGTVIHCLMSGNAVRGINGEIVGFEAIAKDVTARMDGLRRLKAQHRKLSLLNSIAVAMNVTQNLCDILAIALKKLLEALGLSSGGIFLINHDEPGFLLKAEQGLLARLGSNTCHPVFHDFALRKSLIKGNFPLEPQGTFPPFKVTLKAHKSPNYLNLICYLITRKEMATGFIALEVPLGRHIGDEDHRLLGSLGNFLGSAIENSRLLQALREHRGELKGLTARLFCSQEEERKRIAQGLHDEAGQALTGINFMLETIIKTLTPDQADLGEQVLDVKKQINQTYQEIRRISHRLHPAVLTDLGLEPALESYLSDISKYRQMDIDFKMAGFEKRLDPDTETILYRIAQEVVTNTIKHSGAEHFKLFIVKSYPHIILLAEDDGNGFDPSKLDKRRQALGLLSMRERVASVGGSFSIRSKKGEGTRIRIEIPVKELPDE
jgi:PAS domain S-box-containing protein